MSSSNQSGKLFIGGLSFDTTDETFRSYFSQFGEVTDAFVLRDNITKRSRGFGFVTFKTEKGADDCLAYDRPHILDKRQVEAKKATPRDATPGNGGHIRRAPSGGRGGRSSSNTYDARSNSNRGNPSSNSNSSGGPSASGQASSNNNAQGLAPTSSWASKASSGGATSATNGAPSAATVVASKPNPGLAAPARPQGAPHTTPGINGSISATSSEANKSSNAAPPKAPQPPQPPAAAAPTGESQCKKIFVGGLHYDTDKAGLRKYFEQYGKIVSSEVMYNRETNKSRGFGFVIFAESESVDKALENRMHIIDKKEAEVKRATPRTASPAKPAPIAGGVKSYGSAPIPINNVGSGAAASGVVSIPVPPPQQRNMSWANVVSSGAPKDSAPAEKKEDAQGASQANGQRAPTAQPGAASQQQQNFPQQMTPEQMQMAQAQMVQQQAVAAQQAMLQQQALQARQQQLQRMQQMMMQTMEEQGQMQQQFGAGASNMGNLSNGAMQAQGNANEGFSNDSSANADGNKVDSDKGTKGPSGDGNRPSNQGVRQQQQQQAASVGQQGGYFGHGGEGFGAMADPNNTIPMGMGFGSFGGMGGNPMGGNIMGQQAFQMGGGGGYDSLSGMGMDMNSMNMGMSAMDMNSAMGMGSFGLGGMNGFGMTGQQTGGWGDMSGGQQLNNSQGQPGGRNSFGQANLGNAAQQAQQQQNQMMQQQGFGMFQYDPQQQMQTQQHFAQQQQPGAGAEQNGAPATE